MPRLAPVLIPLALAACAPRVYHREAERPVPAGVDGYACAAREVERMGYRLSIVQHGESFTATRPREQVEDGRYPHYDYLAVDVLDHAGAPRMLRVGAVTLAGGGGGVAPHFRAPLPRTEADRDAVLAACAPSAG